MLKQAKVMVITLTIMLLINIGYTQASAVFLQETLPPEEEKTVRQNSSFAKLNEEPAKDLIKCFDVSNDGLIAVGTEGRTKKIVIYDSDNKFVTGYEFEDTGSFGIEWNYGKLNIYSVRGGLVYSLNDDGSIESIARVTNDYFNEMYWNKHVNSHVRTVGKTKYELRKSIEFLGAFSSSYSQIVRINGNDEEEILYDVSSDYLVYSLIMFIGVLLLISIVVFFIIRYFRNQSV